MAQKFQGVIPPIVTPLTIDGQLDHESLARSIEHMLAAGVDALFALGSSGEVAFSTDERRREVIDCAIQTIGGRVPLLVGCIDMQTERVLEHARTAQALGADAIVVTAPFYALGGAVEVENHFRQLADSLEVPLVAYDLPQCVHTKLDGRMLVRLGQEGVLACVKDSSGDDVAFRFLLDDNRAAGSPLTLLTGHEVVVDGAYLAGADGSVPGLGNVDPGGYVRMWHAAQAGDWEAVRQEQSHLARLMRICTVTSGVTGFAAGVGAFKTALALMGVFTSNQMPRPVSRLQGENVEAIARVLADCGIPLEHTPAQVSTGTS